MLSSLYVAICCFLIHVLFLFLFVLAVMFLLILRLDFFSSFHFLCALVQSIFWIPRVWPKMRFCFFLFSFCFIPVLSQFFLWVCYTVNFSLLLSLIIIFFPPKVFSPLMVSLFFFFFFSASSFFLLWFCYCFLASVFASVCVCMKLYLEFFPSHYAPSSLSAKIMPPQLPPAPNAKIIYPLCL